MFHILLILRMPSLAVIKLSNSKCLKCGKYCTLWNGNNFLHSHLKKVGDVISEIRDCFVVSIKNNHSFCRREILCNGRLGLLLPLNVI